MSGDPGLLADPAGPQMVRHDPAGQGAEAAIDIITSFRQGTSSRRDFLAGYVRLPHRPGETDIKAAEEANEPGTFTAFIGYEWTSNHRGNNLHRNVIFRDDGRQGEPGRALTPRNRRSAVPIRATCGNGWLPTKRRPAARFSPSRTTAT